MLTVEPSYRDALEAELVSVLGTLAELDRVHALRRIRLEAQADHLRRRIDLEA